MGEQLLLRDCYNGKLVKKKVKLKRFAHASKLIFVYRISDAMNKTWRLSSRLQKDGEIIFAHL